MFELIGAGISIGTSIAGFLKSSSGASALNAATQQEIQDEQAGNALKEQLAETQFQHQTVINARRTQEAQALGLSNAVTQGGTAEAGKASSAIVAGQGAVGAQGAFNQETLSQDIQGARQMFDINTRISQDRIRMANAQSQMQAGQGLMSLGSSLFSSIGPASKLASGFGSSRPSLGPIPFG